MIPAHATLVFTNTYSAGDVVRVPVALKEYTDHSGQNPLVSGMFRFELKALGVVENNALVPNSVSSVPMPDGSVNGVITTTNEGHNVTFPAATFRHSHIPTGANQVIYDKTEYVVEITVTDDGKGKLVASEPVIQKAGSNEAVARIEFENVYEVPTLPQAPVTGDDPTMGLWIALFVLSTAGLFVTAWSGRKKKAKQH